MAQGRTTDERLKDIQEAHYAFGYRGFLVWKDRLIKQAYFEDVKFLLNLVRDLKSDLVAKGEKG